MINSRDFITPVQRGRLPAFVRSDYPAFEKYIIDYFTWLEQDGNALQILEEWYANTDPDNMVEPYVSAILRDLGWTWEGSLAIPKNLLLKNLRDFYLSRGTKKSFEFLFRALFDEPIAIKYPRERMLVLDQADYASESRVYTTANNRLGTTAAAILADLNGRKHVQMTGIVSGTVATIESIQILLSGDRAYFQITILEPLTDFVVKEDVRIESESGFIIERLHNVMTVEIDSAGSGFNVDDELNVTGAGLNGALGLQDQPAGAQHHRHGQRDEAAKQREGPQKAEELAEKAALIDGIRSGVRWNGTPRSTFPTATPNSSAGTKPPMNSARSHIARQPGSGRLLRYLKATGRRISAPRIRNIAM